MEICPKKDVPRVRRITVDEWLTEDLIRFEVCELVTILPSGEFLDDPEFWKDVDNEGGDVLASSIESSSIENGQNYLELLGLSDNQKNLWYWKDLREGQVFLSGEFEVRERGSGEDRTVSYFGCSEAKRFERIDDDVKKKIKTLYFELLANKGAQ